MQVISIGHFDMYASRCFLHLLFLSLLLQLLFLFGEYQNVNKSEYLKCEYLFIYLFIYEPGLAGRREQQVSNE